MLVHKITLDMDHPERSPIIELKESDKNSHQLVMDVIQNGKSVLEGCSVDFQAKKPDGTTIFDQCEMTDGKAVYTLSGQATTCIGTVEAELVVTDIGDMYFSTPTFFIQVEEKIFDENADVSEDDLTAYRDYMNMARTAAQEAAGSASVSAANAETSQQSVEECRELCDSLAGRIAGAIEEVFSTPGDGTVDTNEDVATNDEVQDMLDEIL